MGMRFIVNLVVGTLAVVIASYIVPGVEVQSMTTALFVALVLGFLNAFVKPLLVILTLPITILTLGLFYFALNALLVLLVSSLIPGFQVQGFIVALVFSFILTIVHSLLNALTK